MNLIVGNSHIAGQAECWKSRHMLLAGGAPSRGDGSQRNDPRMSDEAKPSIGNRIRTLRRERKLTQADLAAAVGWERSTIASIEAGKDHPGRDLLQALAQHFEVSLDWITHGAGGPQPARALNPEEAVMLSLFREAQPAQRSAVVTLLKGSRGDRDN